MPLKNDYVATGDPLTAAQTDLLATQVNTNTTDIGSLASNPISKTANYTALVSDFVVGDASGGIFTVTLPTAPANKARITVIKMDASTNAITVAAGGTARFQIVGGASTLSLSAQYVIAILQYNSVSGIWYVLSGKPIYLSNVDNTSDVTKWAATKTLTNTRVTKRVNNVSGPSATPTLAFDTYDQINLTAIAVAITSMSSGITGTPVDGDFKRIRFKDNGTGRAITWGASWRAIGVTLPTTTVASKTLYVDAVYNAADAKYDAILVGQEP